MAKANHFSEIKSIQDMANFADSCATQIYSFIIQNPTSPQNPTLRAMMREFDKTAAQLDASTLRLFGAINSKAIEAIKEATEEAVSFTKKTNDVKKSLKVFASFLNLAGTLIGGGGIVQIIGAAAILRDTSKAS